MNREAQSIVLVLLGGLLLAITGTGRFTAYVKPGFAPLLWIGGGALVLIGILSLVSAARAALAATPGADDPASGPGNHRDSHHDDHDHDDHDHDDHDHDDHDHDRSRAPWLILVPVLVLLVVAPPALGADALAQYSGSQAVSAVDPTSGAGRLTRDDTGRAVMDFAPLPTGGEPTVTLRDFVLRALYDPQGSVETTTVTVEGFVGPPGSGYAQGWTLARLSIACCAADASALRVHVPGAAPSPENTWVRAAVRAVPDTATAENNFVPTVRVLSLTVIDQPENPYE